jgi:hypothetical protein
LKRFNKSFLGVGNDGHFLECQLTMANHVYVTQGHTTSYPVDPYWYLDTCATDHLFVELEKMQLKEPYHVKERVHTADGSGMRILHVGQELPFHSH